MNVQHGVREWDRKHPSQPIVTMETFEKEIMDKEELNLWQFIVGLLQSQLEKPM
jgi:hypothetical protein